MFENSKNFFEQRLQPSGFNEKLNYTEENSKTNSKSPKHNILCFNPPYSKSDKIDIDQFVLHLVNKNFLPVRKYKKIFKRNIYAQHPKSKISTHYKKKLGKPVNENIINITTLAL